MAKIIEFIDFNKYMQRADEALKSGDLECFQKYLICAKKLAKTKAEKVDVSMKLAKVYAGCGRIYFSNDLLYDVLWNDPKNEEAKSLLMFNFLALGQPLIAKYYYVQVKDYLSEKQDDKFILVKHTLEGNDDKKEELKIENFMQEIFDAAEKDELGEENAKELHQFLGNMLSGDNSQFDGLDLIESEQNRFIVHSKRTKIKDTLNKLYVNLGDENFEKVIEIYNNTDLSKIEGLQKASFYYARAVCHLFYKEYEQVVELSEKALEIDPKKADFIFLKIEGLTKLKRYKEIGKELELLKDFIPSDNAQFKHLMHILMVSEYWDFAIEYLNRHLDKLKNFYMPEEFLGIFYFNSGKMEEAKKTFINLYDKFGDLSHAKNYLFYIKSQVKDGIPLEAMFGDWPKLTLTYVKYLCNLLTFADREFYVTLIDEQETIIEAMKWLAQWPTPTALLDMIERIEYISYCLSRKGKEKIEQIKEKIFKIILTTPFINEEARIDVILMMCLSEEYKTIRIVSEGKYFIAKTALPKNAIGALKNGIALAKAIAISNGVASYEKFEKIIKHLVQVYYDNKLTWRSSEAVCALIVEDYLNLKMEKVASFVKFTKAIKNKYSDQLYEILNPKY